MILFFEFANNFFRKTLAHLNFFHTFATNAIKKKTHNFLISCFMENYLGSEKLTMEEMPVALLQVLKLQNEQGAQIQRMMELLENAPKAEPVNEWLSIDGLCAYLPDHPVKGTIYQWTFNKRIPYYREHGKLRFLKSDIDEWLKSGRHATQKELMTEVAEMLNSKK